MRRRALVACAVLVAGALATLLLGGDWRLYALPALLGCAVAVAVSVILAGLPPLPPAPAETDGGRPVTPLLQAVGRELENAEATVDARALGAQYRREQREAVEQVVNRLLDEFIGLIRSRIDAHTVAVFFPTGEGGYRIQRCWSRSEFVDAQAVIYPGVGVVGSFLKDGLKQLKLQGIPSDSKTLHYYTRDVGIRSLIASPLVSGGTERGTVIVDSVEKRHFTDEDHAYLTSVTSILSQTVYYTYLCNEYRITHDRFVAMSTTEKDFFVRLEMGAILDRMVEVVRYAVACDRLSISLRSEGGESGSVLRVWGEHGGQLQDLRFNLPSATLVGLVYARNLGLYRSFATDRYETRYLEDEPQRRELRSFMAVPIGAGECLGAILLESTRENAFTPTHRNLLARLATSAGLAIEKLRTLQKAEALATHDGLTGLHNHRQFQQLLQDRITRCRRYRDPLSLVLCDIDHFKKINDTWGHPFGDEVLKGVSAALRENVREGIDVAARYGGEEFSLVLYKNDGGQAMEAAERIRLAISRIPFRSGKGDDVRVTMSFGVAVLGEHAANAAALVKRADQALYRAKEGGRNRVEMF